MTSVAAGRMDSRSTLHTKRSHHRLQYTQVPKRPVVRPRCGNPSRQPASLHARSQDSACALLQTPMVCMLIPFNTVEALAKWHTVDCLHFAGFQAFSSPDPHRQSRQGSHCEGTQGKMLQRRAHRSKPQEDLGAEASRSLTATRRQVTLLKRAGSQHGGHRQWHQWSWHTKGSAVSLVTGHPERAFD